MTCLKALPPQQDKAVEKVVTNDSREERVKSQMDETIAWGKVRNTLLTTTTTTTTKNGNANQNLNGSSIHDQHALFLLLNQERLDAIGHSVTELDLVLRNNKRQSHEFFAENDDKDENETEMRVCIRLKLNLRVESDEKITVEWNVQNLVRNETLVAHGTKMRLFMRLLKNSKRKSAHVVENEVNNGEYGGPIVHFYAKYERNRRFSNGMLSLISLLIHFDSIRGGGNDGNDDDAYELVNMDARTKMTKSDQYFQILRMEQLSRAKTSLLAKNTTSENNDRDGDDDGGNNFVYKYFGGVEEASNFEITVQSCNSMDTYFGFERFVERVHNVGRMTVKLLIIVLDCVFFMLIYRVRDETLSSPRIYAVYFGFTGLLLLDIAQFIQSLITLVKFGQTDFILDYDSSFHIVLLEYWQGLAILGAISAYVLMRIRSRYILHFYLSPDPLSKDTIPNVRNHFPRKRAITLWGILFLVVGAVLAFLCFFFVLQGREDLQQKLLAIHRFSCFGLAMIFAVMLTMVDMWLHRRTLREKGLKYYFGFQDPLLFRRENLLIILSFVLFTVCNIPFVIGYAEWRYERKWTLAVLYSVLNITTAIVERLIYAGGLCCIVQLLRNAYSGSIQYFANWSSNTDLIHLQKLLADSEMYDLFEEYCQYEFTVKNLYMWSILLKFVRRDKIERQELDNIIKVYFDDTSVYAVECRASVRRRMRRLLRFHTDERKDDVLLRVIVAVAPFVLSRLNDSFTRFSATEPYAKLMKTREQQQQQHQLQQQSHQPLQHEQHPYLSS